MLSPACIAYYLQVYVLIVRVWFRALDWQKRVSVFVCLLESRNISFSSPLQGDQCPLEISWFLIYNTYYFIPDGTLHVRIY